MTSTAARLYDLLPAIYRMRDAEQGEPLKELIAVIADQVAILEEDLAQLYDDQFIETCAPWVAPYLGDLIGYRALHGVVPRVSSPRAEIANTIGYRRRKGTVAMLEQLARDVTGWDACIVEFFQRLATTQHMNHVRARNRSADLRAWEPLERIDTPFDQLTHTADVRRIVPGRGRYNIPNVGIFLWRLKDYATTQAQPCRVDGWRYRFNPLGIDQPLFTRPETKEAHSGRSTRMNVPEPISRRFLGTYLEDYYGLGRSLVVAVDGRPVQAARVAAADLSDSTTGTWGAATSEKLLIDPVLGRLVFPRGQPAPGEVRVTFHSGFSSEMGGGNYDRSEAVPQEFTQAQVWQIGVNAQQPSLPGYLPTLMDAVLAWNAQPPGTVGVISITDSSSYQADLEVIVAENSHLLIVAAEWPEVVQAAGGRSGVPGRFTAAGCRPHLRGHIRVRTLGNSGGSVCLNGLLVEGGLEMTAGRLGRLSVRHCTFVPGRGFSADGYPVAQREPSIRILATSGALEVQHSITGGIRQSEEGTANISDSMVDATSRCGVAFSAVDGHSPGGALTIANTTVVGKVHTRLLELATNAIFFSRLARHDAWKAPVISTRRQQGCVRFSFVPRASLTPPRYQCQPGEKEDETRVTPLFNSARYGDPGYGQLSERCASEIFTGADDESEMGAFHELYEPQRIANVRVRLDEYLRFGLEAGIFFEPHVASRVLAPSSYGYPRWVDLCGAEGAEELPGIGAGLI